MPILRGSFGIGVPFRAFLHLGVLVCRSGPPYFAFFTPLPPRRPNVFFFSPGCLACLWRCVATRSCCLEAISRCSTARSSCLAPLSGCLACLSSCVAARWRCLAALGVVRRRFRVARRALRVVWRRFRVVWHAFRAAPLVCAWLRARAAMQLPRPLGLGQGTLGVPCVSIWQRTLGASMARCKY